MCTFNIRHIYKVHVLDFNAVPQCMKMHQNVAFSWGKNPSNFSGEGKPLLTSTLLNAFNVSSEINLGYATVMWIIVIVQNDIYEIIRQAFTSATAQPPPKGIGHSPQSRAIYGVDVMLQWITSPDSGESHVFTEQ